MKFKQPDNRYQSDCDNWHLGDHLIEKEGMLSDPVYYYYRLS